MVDVTMHQDSQTVTVQYSYSTVSLMLCVLCGVLQGHS